MACIRRIRAGELSTRGVRGWHLPRSRHSTDGARQGSPLRCQPSTRGPPAGTRPDSYSRIWRDATISIARLTLSDSDRWSNWAYPGTETLRLVVDASPLVMAIWSLLGHIWTSPTLSPRSTRQHRKRRITPLVQEDRPRTCPHVHQRPSRC